MAAHKITETDSRRRASRRAPANLKELRPLLPRILSALADISAGCTRQLVMLSLAHMQAAQHVLVGRSQLAEVAFGGDENRIDNTAVGAGQGDQPVMFGLGLAVALNGRLSAQVHRAALDAVDAHRLRAATGAQSGIGLFERADHTLRP